ncbi:hypothetical protein D9M71_830240 [compost metagenome]
MDQRGLHHVVERAGRNAGDQHQYGDQRDGDTKHHEGASPIKRAIEGGEPGLAEKPVASGHEPGGTGERQETITSNAAARYY